MNKRALIFAALALTLPCAGPANAATGTDFVNAVQSFVKTGLSNLDSNFSPLRGAPIVHAPGEHYEVKTSFGEFLPNCHISGYQPPQSVNPEWVFSCSSPGLGANPKILHQLIYEGVIRSLPACYTRTLNPVQVGTELFRWDCHQGDHAMSVDVSSSPTSNGDASFLLEVYKYIGALPPPATPAPSPTPMAVRLVKPQPTLTMGGVDVPYNDYATLNLAVHAALLPPGKDHALPHVVEMLKAGNEMPAFDWVWHYAGKQTQNGAQALSVWVCGNLSPQEQSIALTQATLMALLDSGQGGAALQKAYIAARDADAALGPQAEDPFANRRKLIYAMTPFF